MPYPFLKPVGSLHCHLNLTDIHGGAIKEIPGDYEDMGLPYTMYFLQSAGTGIQSSLEKKKMPYKEPTPDYVIIGAVQLEQERSTLGNGFEIHSAARPPEVHLIRLVVSQKVKPVVVGDGEEEFHGFD